MRVLFLVKLQGKSNTPPWVFFTSFKLYKWNQIVQSITISLGETENFHDEKKP